MRLLPQSRARLMFFACLLIAGYFAYTALVGAFETSRLAEERQEAEQQVELLKAQKAYIEGVREYVSTDQYVEQEARRQLGYVRPGEIPFVVISPAVEADTQAAGEWWERLFPR